MGKNKFGEEEEEEERDWGRMEMMPWEEVVSGAAQGLEM